MEEITRQNNDSILFVLVIYGCKAEESTALKTLIGLNGADVEHVFVYDNSPTPQTTSLQVAHYISDTHNGGLGKAYNTAFRYAKAQGYGWLLLLDQDTTFPPNALQAYRSALQSNRDVQLIAPRHKVNSSMFMSPTRYRRKTSKLQAQSPTGIVSFDEASPINSGILVSVSSFEAAGGYVEQVWLDFSDICFVERYKKIYSHYYVLPDVVCLQEFSALETDEQKVFSRFRIYLECALAYPCTSQKDRLELTYTVLRQSLSKALRRRSLKYLTAFMSIYMSGHSKHTQ